MAWLKKLFCERTSWLAMVSRLTCHGAGYALNAGQGHLGLFEKRGVGDLLV